VKKDSGQNDIRGIRFYMDSLIYPDIFSNSVKAFFTKKTFGANIDNIRRLLSIKKAYIYLPIQKHTDKVKVLNSDLKPEIADAVITQRKGILIGVQVADCVPALLYDEKNIVVGAVHAGWRGTAAQIIKKTIRAMNEQYGSLTDDIIVALGPSIRGNCYEVDTEVKDAICKATGNGEYYIRKKRKYCVDLSSANMLQAMSAGVHEKNIWISNECTYCNPDTFYSYRHSKKYNGSQGGFIGIF
jgi:polyphenol oxidase